MSQWKRFAGSERSVLTDVALVGGKGANLGELRTAGLPVPPGFVVTAPCIEAFGIGRAGRWPL